MLVGEGRTTVAIPLSQQEEMQSSRAQADRLALDRSVDRQFSSSNRREEKSV